MVLDSVSTEPDGSMVNDWVQHCRQWSTRPFLKNIEYASHQEPNFGEFQIAWTKLMSM